MCNIYNLNPKPVVTLPCVSQRVHSSNSSGPLMRPPLIWNASTPLLNGCALQSDLVEAESERNLKFHSANHKFKEIQSSSMRINIAHILLGRAHVAHVWSNRFLQLAGGARRPQQRLLCDS